MAQQGESMVAEIAYGHRTLRPGRILGSETAWCEASQTPEYRS